MIDINSKTKNNMSFTCNSSDHASSNITGPGCPAVSLGPRCSDVSLGPICSNVSLGPRCSWFALIQSIHSSLP